jgi:oxygen-independent coproporphyrinogen-3 oxidase
MHLYLHIPFCKQACHYCDFHFSTNTVQKKSIVESICKEIVLRKNYLNHSVLHTIYFGGGTPSLLDADELHLILQTIHDNFEVASDAEITLEANPDDLNKEKIKQLAIAGINRLSIGIQSFYDPHLQYLNRAHQALEAEISVKQAQDYGIENISIDLIYAIPYPDHSILEQDIAKAFALNVSHISAYCLTIEPQTAFGNWLKKAKIKPIDEEFAAKQFEILIDRLGQNGFEQYEISNFARNNHYSKHNTSYWMQEPYLGVGPSAHSYNGFSREFNVAHNTKYITSIQQDLIPSTVEQLTFVEQTNEYLLTGLRTKWGVNSDVLEQLSKGNFKKQHAKTLENLRSANFLQIDQNLIKLTESGKLFADRITGDLFLED